MTEFQKHSAIKSKEKITNTCQTLCLLVYISMYYVVEFLPQAHWGSFYYSHFIKDQINDQRLQIACPRKALDSRTVYLDYPRREKENQEALGTNLPISVAVKH